MEKENKSILDKNLILFIGVFIFFVITIFIFSKVQYDSNIMLNNNIIDIQKDTNQLLADRNAMFSYIGANSQAIVELQNLQKVCKLIEDNNYSYTIQCTLQKEQAIQKTTGAKK